MTCAHVRAVTRSAIGEELQLFSWLGVLWPQDSLRSFEFYFNQRQPATPIRSGLGDILFRSDAHKPKERSEIPSAMSAWCFMIAHAPVKKLNATTNRDAPAAQRDKTGGKWYSGMARGTSWTLFFGATAGAAVGVLHFTALANGRKIEVFELLDAPVTAFMDRVREKLGCPPWTPNMFGLESLAVILYWTLLSLFVAAFICLARHPNYRRVMIFGAGGGLLVGCLNWLAIVNHWFRLWVSFAFLDRPVEPARKAIGYWINGRFYFRQIQDVIRYEALTYVVYWFVIGLILAFTVCVIRMLVKGRAGRVSPLCVNRDVCSASPDQSGGGVTSRANRARNSGSAAFFGLVAGLAVGGLNIVAVANGGVFEFFFDIFDSPVILLTRAARSRFDFLAAIDPRLYDIYSFIAVFCYWAVIGMLLAKRFYVLRSRKSSKQETPASEK